MNAASVSMEFFEAKYKSNLDPWLFETSHYELNRYGAIIESLGTRCFERAFEPGCSIGVLTQKLAGVCNQVLAMDISSTAVAHARVRCGSLAGVAIEQGALPADIPAGDFDLIVLSEIGYYFEALSLKGIVDSLVPRLMRGGLLVAAHWLGCSDDHILHGDEVHTVLRQAMGVEPVESKRYDGFRIDVWRCG